MSKSVQVFEGDGVNRDGTRRYHVFLRMPDGTERAVFDRDGAEEGWDITSDITTLGKVYESHEIESIKARIGKWKSGNGRISLDYSKSIITLREVTQ